MKANLKMLLFVAISLGAPLAAQPSLPSAASLAPELQTGLRCAALFSIVASQQARGDIGKSDWPPLGLRGREFFVRIAARVMDAAKVDRSGIQALMRSEVIALNGSAAAAHESLKAPCLAMLDATIPPAVGRQP
jgi:hypothetical protein